MAVMIFLDSGSSLFSLTQKVSFTCERLGVHVGASIVADVARDVSVFEFSACSKSWLGPTLFNVPVSDHPCKSVGSADLAEARSVIIERCGIAAPLS